jgi:hypothetical protein
LVFESRVQVSFSFEKLLFSDAADAALATARTMPWTKCVEKPDDCDLSIVSIVLWDKK